MKRVARFGVAGWLTCALAFAVGPTLAAGPEGTLAATGVVVDSSEQPQAGVPVKVEGPLGEAYAITDEKGAWSLYNLPPGSYEVKPIDGAQAETDQSVKFSVEQLPFWERWFGSDATAYQAPPIVVEQRFQQ